MLYYNCANHSLRGAINAMAMAAALACLALRFGGSVLWGLCATVALAATCLIWRPASDDISAAALPWGVAGSVAVAGMALLPWGALHAAVTLGAIAGCLYAIGAVVHVRDMARAERRHE